MAKDDVSRRLVLERAGELGMKAPHERFNLARQVGRRPAAQMPRPEIARRLAPFEIEEQRPKRRHPVGKVPRVASDQRLAFQHFIAAVHELKEVLHKEPHHVVGEFVPVADAHRLLPLDLAIVPLATGSVE